MRLSPTSPIGRRRSRWHYPVMWLWLAQGVVSWALVVGCGFGIAALIAYLLGR